MSSTLSLLFAALLAPASIAPPASTPTRSAEAVLGIECIDQTQEDVAARHPGLKLPGKQYVMISRVAMRRFADGSALNAGDFLVKIDGKAIKTVDDLSAVLEKLELPGEVKVEFLDITSGPRPRTKRETVTIKAVKPATASEPSQPAAPSSGTAPVKEATPEPPKVQVDYDKFKDQTRVSASDRPIIRAKYAPAEFHVGFFTNFEGKSWKERPEYRLRITSSDTEWRFMRRDLTLYLVIDDEKPIELPNSHYGNDVMKGRNFCWEYMSWTLEPELAKRLQQAKKVECKVSVVEFDFPAAAVASLREFDRVIDGLDSSTAPGNAK